MPAKIPASCRCFRGNHRRHDSIRNGANREGTGPPWFISGSDDHPGAERFWRSQRFVRRGSGEDAGPAWSR